MSWLFSRALAEDYWRAASSDGVLYVPSRLTGTGDNSWSHGKTTEVSRPFPYGMTSEHLTVSHGEDVLMWCLEVSHVKPIPARLEAATRRMTSGRKCGESWQRSLPGTYLPRTPKDARLIVRPTTWKRWGMKPAVFPFPRLTWARTMFGIDTGYVHTPTATANYMAPSMKKWPGCREFARVFGMVSPEIHEHLMGWPIGWSALKPLETGRFQSWLRQHGG